jgi:hypothetical protein
LKNYEHPCGGFASLPLAGGDTCGLAKPVPRYPLEKKRIISYEPLIPLLNKQE